MLHNLIKFHSQNQENNAVQDWTSAVEQGDGRGGEALEEVITMSQKMGQGQ